MTYSRSCDFFRDSPEHSVAVVDAIHGGRPLSIVGEDVDSHRSRPLYCTDRIHEGDGFYPLFAIQALHFTAVDEAEYFAFLNYQAAIVHCADEAYALDREFDSARA